MLIEDKFCNKFSEKYGCVINQPAVERWNLKFVECSTHTHSLSLSLPFWRWCLLALSLPLNHLAVSKNMS